MPTYTTEDGVQVRTGDAAFNYYDQRPGVIGRDTGNGWFEFDMDPSEGRGRCILDGSRICSVRYAQRRGWIRPDEQAANRFSWNADMDAICRHCGRPAHEHDETFLTCPEIDEEPS